MASNRGTKSWRCRLGLHDRHVYDVRTELHMGFFGGPLTTYYWTCRRCGLRGTT